MSLASAKRFHITHGAQVMALSMGIERIADVPAHTLYLRAAKRYHSESKRRAGNQWPMERLIRMQVFYYGRDKVLQQLKGGA